MLTLLKPSIFLFKKTCTNDPVLEIGHIYWYGNWLPSPVDVIWYTIIRPQFFCAVLKEQKQTTDVIMLWVHKLKIEQYEQ
jgi:hypothetical protein